MSERLFNGALVALATADAMAASRAAVRSTIVNGARLRDAHRDIAASRAALAVELRGLAAAQDRRATSRAALAVELRGLAAAQDRRATSRAALAAARARRATK